MPRRVIRLGLQPSQFSFQDDYGPLVNGLASAAESFMSGGQRRAELEMAREQRDKQEALAQQELQRQANRDIASDQFRERELGLQEQGVTDRRNAAMRDDVGGLLKGVAGFFKGPSDAAQRLAFDKDQAKLKTEKPGKDIEAERAFTIAKQILADENATTQDKVWARKVVNLPALPISEGNPLPSTAVSPSGQPLVVGPEGTGYIPQGFERAPTPDVGAVFSTGLTSADQWNASQGLGDMAAQDIAPQPALPADNIIMEEIQANPERLAKWSRLPEDRRAKYLALFNLPQTPKNERIRLTALQAFNQEP